MFKVLLILSLSIVASVSALQEAAEANAAPEPYSYGYQTDSHAAAEQRDPSGKVTGYYTLVGEDGRERRVDYTADEGGFRARVATNEVGTKSESPADVEVQASEPTQGQYAQSAQYMQSAQYAQGAQVQAQAPVFRQQAVYQQRVVQAAPQAAQVARTSSATYFTQPQYYPYNSGYYGTGYGAGFGAGYGTGYGTGYTYAPASYGYYGSGNYNYHTPAQYYSAARTVTAPTVGYTVGSNGYRFVTQPASGVTTTAVRTVASGPAAVTYSAVPVGVSTTGTTSQSGSSNYVVLQKRAAAAKEEKAASS